MRDKKSSKLMKMAMSSKVPMLKLMSQLRASAVDTYNEKLKVLNLVDIKGERISNHVKLHGA